MGQLSSIMTVLAYIFDNHPIAAASDHKLAQLRVSGESVLPKKVYLSQEELQRVLVVIKYCLNVTCCDRDLSGLRYMRLLTSTFYKVVDFAAFSYKYSFSV